MVERNRRSREKIVRNIKLNISAHQLDNEPAAKVLWVILDNYVQRGLPCSTELRFKNRGDVPRKFVVKLHNNKLFDDTVLITRIDQ